MGSDEQRTRRGLTPLESELRAETQPPLRHERPRPQGPLRRLSDWRRRPRPPRTLAGAVALGLLKLAVGVALASALAVLLARLLGRPSAIGFYVLGAIVLLSALVGAQASRQRMVYEYGESGRPPRARPGMLLAAVGVLLILVGAMLETV